MNRRGDNAAIDAYEALTKIMAAFQARLDADHEVGAYVASAEIAFHVRSVRRDGLLLVVEGVDEAGVGIHLNVRKSRFAPRLDI